MEFMLDTDTCIYLINRHPKMQRKAPPAQCAISVIVLGELERAVRRSKRPEPTVEFMHRINVIPLEDDATRAYGYIRDYLESTGQMIGPNDLWIAAHAYALNVALVTNNTREFYRVPELTVTTWLDD